MNLLEPAVALTDLGLTIENAIFVGLLARLPTSETTARRWWMLFFAGLALAALLGFISHGFLADKDSSLHTAVWTTVLLAIGAVALAAWAIGAQQLWPDRAQRVTRAAILYSVLYAAVVLAGFRQFFLAIAFYLPATLFLLTALIVRHRRNPATYLRAGVIGLLLTLIAALVQQAGIALHRAHFDHNALYHLIQAVALLLVYRAAGGLLRSDAPR